jgi:hypothetical protein
MKIVTVNGCNLMQVRGLCYSCCPHCGSKKPYPVWAGAASVSKRVLESLLNNQPSRVSDPCRSRIKADICLYVGFPFQVGVGRLDLCITALVYFIKWISGCRVG